MHLNSILEAPIADWPELRVSEGLSNFVSSGGSQSVSPSRPVDAV
jgi:hypothetical protein